MLTTAFSSVLLISVCVYVFPHLHFSALVFLSVKLGVMWLALLSLIKLWNSFQILFAGGNGFSAYNCSFVRDLQYSLASHFVHEETETVSSWRVSCRDVSDFSVLTCSWKADPLSRLASCGAWSSLSFWRHKPGPELWLSL